MRHSIKLPPKPQIMNKGKQTSEYRRWYRLKRRKEILEMLGGECARCGLDDVRLLQVDHVNGDGAKERKEPGGFGVHKAHKLIRLNPERYQLLCANCNWLKRIEDKETLIPTIDETKYKKQFRSLHIPFRYRLKDLGYTEEQIEEIVLAL